MPLGVTMDEIHRMGRESGVRECSRADLVALGPLVPSEPLSCGTGDHLQVTRAYEPVECGEGLGLKL